MGLDSLGVIHALLDHTTKVVTIETGNFPGLALEGKSITGSPFKSRAWGAVSFLLSSLVLLGFSLRSLTESNKP